MQKSKIEWTDYSINPVKGLCPMACPYCYARAMYKRFKWNPEIRLDWSVANEIPKMKKGSHIFWGSTMELFGDWVDPEWLGLVFNYISNFCQDYTHIFLTKNPANLIKWSPFPKNCWIGVSLPMQLDNYGHDITVNRFDAIEKLKQVEATVKFISFEPLMSPLCVGYRPKWWAEKFKEAGVNWIIVGQKTPVRSFIPYEWVEEIVDSADQIPVFLKNNLNSCEISDYPKLLDKNGMLRQEFPR